MPLRDRYGRTIADVQDAQRRAGYIVDELGPEIVDCTDPECPDWQLSTDGIFWQHTHRVPNKET